MSVLLFTGHRLDWLHRPEARFPPEEVPEVRRRLRQALSPEGPLAPVQAAVCSLAAGSDLLFAEQVLALGVPLHAFLPFRLPDFVAQSVCYPKPPSERHVDWQLLFDQALAQARAVHYSSHRAFQPAAHQYLDCNWAMLGFAQQLAAAQHTTVAGLAYLDDAAEGQLPGGSSHFRHLLRRHAIPVLTLPAATTPMP